MMHDLINDAITSIRNSVKVGKSECTIKPTSQLLVEVLKVFQKEGYIEGFEQTDNGRGGAIKIKLGKIINDCGVIKPRFPVRKDSYVKWEKRFLPASDFGLLVVSTPKGVMSHKESKAQGHGGRLLAYIY
ncbi:MAG: 30S ribosomal protein S8 [Candidatus Altiarchaeota archaeon]|nr:30S ribosomal protein S8 [Candidatus Altiarchaeota archaeon]